jgi:hypothetical protein
MKTKDIIAILLAFALALTVIICSIINVTDNSRMEPITDFIDVELAKNETCRLEILCPIGKSTDGVDTIFADEGGEMWVMNNFYAEENDVFVALMGDNGTKDKTDDRIIYLWLTLNE